jgi:cation transport ATPase
MKKASRISISAFGVITAFAGIEHGIGEILQGNHAPAGVIIESWPGSPFFRMLAGEPAMTIIPNLLATGILTILTTLFFLLWSTLWNHKKIAGWMMILSAIAMLLSGAGMSPPILVIILSVATIIMNTPSRSKRPYQPSRFQQLRAKLWPGSLIISLATWLLVIPGLPLLDYYGNVNNPTLVVVLVLFALGTLLLTLIFARSRDAKSSFSTPE